MRLYILILFILFSFSLSGQHMMLAGGAEEEGTPGFGLPAEEDLLLYLDAGNPSSYPGTGTDWYDLTDNNNDFQIFVESSYNSDTGYIDFLSDGYAQSVANFVETNAACTVCAWINLPQMQANLTSLFLNKGNSVRMSVSSNTRWISYLYDNSGGLIANTNDNRIQDDFTTNTWNLYCIRTNGTTGDTLEVIGNNVLKSWGLLSGNRGLSNQKLNIAFFNTTYDGFVKAAQVFIWEKRLTDQELTDLYNDTNRY